MALIGASNTLGGLAGSNALARLLVVISGDSSPLTNAVRSAEGKLSGFAGKASAIGKTFTRYLTLPLLALSGIAVKFAIDFNAAVARVAGLTPIMEQTGMSIQDISDSIIKMAEDPRITAGPTELANALYFAGSAGLTFGEAMDVVKLSAEGASIGMGEASDISKVLIYAMNAYAGTGLTAASAMDALTAAIREGTAEPNEMAIALGRLLPIAAEAGITFQQVVASVAALTNLGMPVRVATTSLRALLTGIFVPTIEATETLHALGLEADDLRDTMRAGPIAVFKELQKATKGNFDYLHDVIPTIRGFTAYLGLTGNAAEKYEHIIDEVNHSQGDFNKAMSIFVETPAFKFQKALQSMQIAAIDLGSVMLPVFTKIMTGITRLATAFSEMPDWAKQALAAFIALGAAIGPILQLIGAVTELSEVTLAFGAARGLSTMLPTFRAIGIGAAAMAAGVAIASLSFSDLTQNGLTLANGLGIVAGSFLATRIAIGAFVTAARAGVLGASNLMFAIGGLGGGWLTIIAAALAGVALAIGQIISKSHSMARSAEETQTSLLESATSADTFGQALDKLKDKEVAENLRDIAEAAKALNLPTAGALEKVMPRSGEVLLAQVEHIQGRIRELGYDVGEVPWDKFVDGIKESIATGKPLADTLLKQGTNLDALLNILGDVQGYTGLTDLGHDAEQAAFNFQNFGEVMKDYQIEQRATMLGHLLEGEAVADLADKYGVSTEFMQGKLQDFGVAAYGMAKDVETVFAREALGVEEGAKKISARATEMSDAIAASAQTIGDSMRSSFDLFNQLPDKFKGTTSSMVANTQKWADAMLTQAANIRNLLGRGVPLDMLEKLIAEGPDAVGKFAAASDQELQRAVLAYRVGLGAMDDEILKEGAHQIVKGQDMVSDFVAAMLSRNYLLPEAGKEIVQLFQQGLLSGDLKKPALDLMTQFVNFLTSSQVPLSSKAGSAVAVTFAQALVNKPLMQRSSRQIMAVVSSSLQTAGIGKKKADDLAFAFVNGLNAQSGTVETQAQAAVAGAINTALSGLPAQAHAIGVAIDLQLAGGIKSAGGAAILAAETVATNVENALKDSLRNSPRLFTYYVGKDLVKELGEGVKHGNRDVQMHRPTVSVYDNRGPLDRGRANGTVSKRPLEVRLDRKRFTQEIAYEETYRGLL